MLGPVGAVVSATAPETADWERADGRDRATRDRIGPHGDAVSGQHPGVVLAGKAKHQQPA
jgi:hypothetical protein